jgi:site-specific DNA-methyltransferase (adenine-specific)
MEPYYEREGITIYHGDALDFRGLVEADVLVTDPPYGIDYESNRFGTLPRSIHGDVDTAARDGMLAWWGSRPALIFGSWRRPRPERTRQLLVWDSGGALGLGALDLPWKPAHQEIYVLGGGFKGRRTTDVLRYPPVQSMAKNGRVHPHEKPIALMRALLQKCPPGAVLDPFAGSGSTLRAAFDLRRKAIGIEIEERYCEIAAQRLSQEVLV